MTQLALLLEEQHREPVYEAATACLSDALAAQYVVGLRVVDFLLYCPVARPKCLGIIYQVLIAQEHVDWRALAVIYKEMGVEAVEPFLRILETGQRRRYDYLTAKLYAYLISIGFKKRVEALMIQI